MLSTSIRVLIRIFFLESSFAVIRGRTKNSKVYLVATFFNLPPGGHLTGRSWPPPPFLFIVNSYFFFSSRLREKNKSRLMGNSFGAQGNGFGPHTTMLGFQTTMLGSQTTVAGLNTSSQNNSTFNKSGGWCQLTAILKILEYWISFIFDR